MPTAWLRRGALLAALTVTLGVGGASLIRRVFDPLPGDGLRWAAGSEGPVARVSVGGVQRGDRLLSVDGQPIAGLVDLALLDRHALVGQVRRLGLLRDGRVVEQELVVQAGRAPLSYLLLALCGLLALAAGLRLGLASRGAPGRGLAAAAALAFGLTALASPAGWMDGADRLFVAADEVGRLLFPALLLHAALALRRTRLGAWAVALYLPTAVLALADLAYFAGGSRLGSRALLLAGSVLDRGAAFLLAVEILAAALVAADAFRRSTGDERLALRWLGVAALGLGPYSLAWALPQALGGGSVGLGEAALLTLAPVPVALANAFLGRHLSWRLLGRRRVMLVAEMLLGVGAALATGALLSSLLGAIGWPAWLGYATVALLALVLVHGGLRDAARNLLDSTLDREAYEARRELLAFGREVAAEMRFVELAEALGERLRRAFRAEAVAIYARGEAGALTLVGGGSPGVPARLHLSGDELKAASGRTFPVTAVAALEGLVQAGLSLGVPLVCRGRLVGLIALGGVAPGLLDATTRRLLEDLAGYAAVAVENGRLYAELLAQAETLRDQEQFQAGIIESLDIGVLILDLEGRVLGSNRAFRALLGRDQVAPGERAAALLPPEFLDPPREGDTRLVTLGGRAIALGSSLLRRSAGAIHGRILVAEDVSARVREESERLRREKLASVGLLAAGVAHEVNTPLAGIASYVQMLLESTEAGDPRHVFLQKIEKQSFRAARLVRNLLNFARPGDGVAGRVDLNEVATETLSLLEHETRRGQVRVDLDLDPSLPPVNGRRGELEQVTLNLLKNAIDAMPGGGRLRLATAAAGERVRLQIEDSGGGIQPELLERIFEPFVTTKERGRGHGLGLAVSYSIVKAHQGDCWLESQPGRGTRATVELPAIGVRTTPGASGGGVA